MSKEKEDKEDKFASKLISLLVGAKIGAMTMDPYGREGHYIVTLVTESGVSVEFRSDSECNEGAFVDYVQLKKKAGTLK